MWPENAEAARVFLALDSQWRVSVAALGGLMYWGFDFHAIEIAMRRCRVRPANRDQVFEDVCLMASAAAEEFNAKRNV